MQCIEDKHEIGRFNADFIGSDAEIISNVCSQGVGVTEKFSSLFGSAWRYLVIHWVRVAIVSCICIVCISALFYANILRSKLNKTNIANEQLQEMLSVSQGRIVNLRNKLNITENKLERAQWIISNTKKPDSIQSQLPSAP